MARRKRTTSVRRKRSRSGSSLGKVGINTSLMLDTAIAAAIVQIAPDLANSFLFKSNPLTGQMTTLVGIAGSYLYGMLMKNNNVANIGIALGAVEFVMPTVKSALGLSDYFQMSDYGNLTGLKEYVNDPSTRQSVHQYADSY